MRPSLASKFRFGVPSVRVGPVASSDMVSAAPSRPAKLFPLMSLIAVAVTLICTGVFAPVFSAMMERVCNAVSVMTRVLLSPAAVAAAAPSKVTPSPPRLSDIVIPDNVVTVASIGSLKIKDKVNASKFRFGVPSVRVGPVASSDMVSAAPSRPAKLFPLMSLIAVAVTLICTGVFAPMFSAMIE